MNPRIIDGWVVVDIEASEYARIEIGLLNGNSKAFSPAFFDYVDGKRVAKVRPNGVAGRTVVYLRVNGVDTMAGNLVI